MSNPRLTDRPTTLYAAYLRTAGYPAQGQAHAGTPRHVTHPISVGFQRSSLHQPRVVLLPGNTGGKGEGWEKGEGEGRGGMGERGGGGKGRGGNRIATSMTWFLTLYLHTLTKLSPPPVTNLFTTVGPDLDPPCSHRRDLLRTPSDSVF